MGRDKSELAHRDGGTFLERSIERMEPSCDEVVIAGPRGVKSYVVIADPVSDRGPVTGIAATLNYANEHGFEACLVTPVDLPFLTSDDLGLLRASWIRTRQTTIAKSGDIEPLIGIYSVDDLPRIGRLAEGDDRSLYRFLNGGQITYQTVQLERSHCRNINTPDEFEDHVN